MHDEELKDLEEWIRRLKIEYDIFFAGNRKKPPDDLRIRVEKTVKRLAEATNMNPSERFLYNTLIARFYVYRDLWRRTQQERESAEGASRTPACERRHRPAETRGSTIPQEIQISIRDPESEVEKIRRLYDELLRIRGGNAKGSPDVSYPQFAAYIATKTIGMKKDYGCSSVTFRVALEDDTIRFVAKADNESG